MFSSDSFFVSCFDNPKTEEEKYGELRAYEQRQEEISNLPIEVGWPNSPDRLYRGFWFPEPLLNGVLSVLRNLRPVPSDLFLITYPKSGTTWLKALAFCISNRIPGHQSSSSNGHHSILSRHPQDCSPYLEILYSSPHVPNMDAIPSPRQLGTHIPYSLLPESVRAEDSPCRIVYLCREPKDTLVSTYHFANAMSSERGVGGRMPMEEAVELFCKGRSMYGPVWEHQLEYWRESQRRPEKLLFLKYEDILAEPEEKVRELAKFMGRPFSPEEESNGMVAEIVRLCSFENLSGLEVNKTGVRGKGLSKAVKNSSFFRKGKIGDWRENLTAEMAEKIDAITRDKLYGTGLSHWPEPPIDDGR